MLTERNGKERLAERKRGRAVFFFFFFFSFKLSHFPRYLLDVSTPSPLRLVRSSCYKIAGFAVFLLVTLFIYARCNIVTQSLPLPVP